RTLLGNKTARQRPVLMENARASKPYRHQPPHRPAKQIMETRARVGRQTPAKETPAWRRATPARGDPAIRLLATPAPRLPQTPGAVTRDRRVREGQSISAPSHHGEMTMIRLIKSDSSYEELP